MLIEFAIVMCQAATAISVICWKWNNPNKDSRDSILLYIVFLHCLQMHGFCVLKISTEEGYNYKILQVISFFKKLASSLYALFY